MFIIIITIVVLGAVAFIIILISIFIFLMFLFGIIKRHRFTPPNDAIEMQRRDLNNAHNPLINPLQRHPPFATAPPRRELDANACLQERQHQSAGERVEERAAKDPAVEAHPRADGDDAHPEAAPHPETAPSHPRFPIEEETPKQTVAAPENNGVTLNNAAHYSTRAESSGETGMLVRPTICKNSF